MLHLAPSRSARPASLVLTAMLPLAARRALLATFTLAAPAVAAAQERAVRRHTVAVVQVADRGPASRTAAAKAPARPKSTSKPAAKKPAAKPAVRTAATLVDQPPVPEPMPIAAVADTGDTSLVLPPAETAAGEVAAPTVFGPVTAPAAPAREMPRFVRYRSSRDSVAGAVARTAVGRAKGLRVAVSLESRELAVLDGADTLLVAPVAIGMDTTIRYGSRSWSFDTPRGKRKVNRKDENPVWIPPDWHYVEVAARRGFKLGYLPAKATVPLSGGRKLALRGNRAGVIEANGVFSALPLDEEIVFGNTLYVPPAGSENRRIPGELGRFRLDLGNGYQLHGTPHEDTIGDAATHGCIRLYDEDIEWLYQNVPVGTPVYIF